MKGFTAALITLVLLGLSVSVLLADPPIDLTQQQSPPKPGPDWLKIIDQGQNDPRLKGYLTPEGLKVEIVADFPTIVNPVGMTFDADGTLYVLEWVAVEGANFPTSEVTFTYKDGSTRKVAIMKKPVKDRVKILRDSKGKGVYDEAKVILEDELPSSILVHDGWLYLTGQGTVRRYRLADVGANAKDRQPKAEVIAQGFCGYHHHQVSGLTIGNDGWFYITSGDDDNVVEGSDGSRATVLRTGAIFRCRPDGSKMQAYALGFRNPYRDVSFDTAFNMFHADNDNEDGSKFTGCRLMHVAEGSDFGWRLRLGARCCVPDHLRGAAFGERPGKVTPMLKTGRGSPAGLLIYNDTRFPEQYRGLLYYPDVFRKVIRAYKVEPKGATFEIAEELELMKSADPLFRPCQMVLGPDGAMYICDWRTDSGGAGRLSGDGVHGRIYRVSWAGAKDQPAIPLRGMDSWAKIVKLEDAGLLRAMAGAEFSDRQQAQQELVRRGAKNRPALLKMLQDGEQPLSARIAALGALQSFWNKEVSTAFVDLLDDPSPDLRRLAADGLALNTPAGDKDVHEALVRGLSDEEPSSRRAIVLAIGHIASPGAADALVTTLEFDTGKDEYLRDGIVRAIEAVGKPGMDKLLALADSGVAKDRERVVETFLALRTRAGFEALPQLLKSYHLTSNEKANLIRSYTNYLLDPPISLDPVADYLAALPRPEKGTPVSEKEAAAQAALLPVKLAGLEVLSSGGSLTGAKTRALLLSMLDERNADVRLAVIKAVADTRLAKAGPRLVELLGQGGRSLAERAAIVKALSVLQEKSAAPALRALLEEKGPSAVSDGVRAEALRALALIDVKAAVEVAGPFLESQNSPLQKEAVLVLANRPEGARLAAQRFLEKKLPRELLSQVADALRRHAGKDPELASLLTEVMRGGLLVSLEPAEVKRIRELVRTRGSAQRGRQLYLNNKALACIGCHRLEGVGGSVGPDLTRIWDTHSLEKVMEAIIDPSKEIKEGYQSWVATTTGGQVFTGLKISQTADEVVLRDQTGKDVRIPAKDLEQLLASKKSLMPDDVVRQLQFNEFLDLVAFLQDRSAQESLRGLALEFQVVGPFSPDMKAAQAPEQNPDSRAVYTVAGNKLAWQAQQADARGYLDLRTAFSGKDVSAYALTYVYAPKAQKVRLLCGAGGPLRVWLNGKMVHEHLTPRAPRPDEDQVPVTLNAGWNSVLLRTEDVPGSLGLYLRFADGEDLRIASRPETK